MMETKTYTTIDRAALRWPNGPWDDEPDKMQWPDEATGLPCLAKRNSSLGNWCGYVGVSENHPLHGVGYSDVDVSVHGGLTFSNTCDAGGDEATAICHVPAQGEPENVWWFGFDCAHAGDSFPGRNIFPWESWGLEEYRTLDYVRRECASLAGQLASMTYTLETT